MQKKSLVLFMGMFIAIPSIYAFGESPTLDYIRNTGDGIYRMYGKSIPSDHSLVNIYVDDKKIGKMDVVFTKEGIDLKNFYRSSGTFALEFMKAEYDSGGLATYVTDKKTDAIKIRKNSNVSLDGQIFRENKNGCNIITLPFIKKLSSDDWGQDGMKSDTKIVINGQEKPLVRYADVYENDAYYFTSQGITFIEKNLTERLSTIGFKIDGLISNQMSVIKEGIALDTPSRILIENIGVSKNLKMYFSEPRGFNNLNGKEIFINGNKIDNKDATIGLGQFVVQYDLLNLPKDQDALSILLKDTAVNQYSNEQVIDISDYSRPTITSIDTGKGESANFTFKIGGNTTALLGDVYKLKININGTDYTRDGTREAVKDGSGVTRKDAYGEDRYEIKNKIEFKKTGEGLEFDFFYSLLNNNENILFIKNDNTGRESNKVSFTKNQTTPANYAYLTGSALTESTKKESLVFETGKDLEKKINPTTMATTDRDIQLGKLKLLNLRDNEYYSLAFTADTTLSVNPFSSITLDTTIPETRKNGDKLVFVFKKQGFGKDFKKDMDFIATIQELNTTTDIPFLLNIREINLKKLTKEGSFETISALKNPLKGSVFYSYENDTCFDGIKDFCSLIGEADPVLTLKYSASGTPIVIDAPATTVTPLNTAGAVVVKKNISYIVVQDFKNEKFKKVQDILSKKYEALKRKGSIHVPTFRKASNNLLGALKNFELKTQVIESIAQVKSALKTINEVLKQAKKE